MADSTPRGVDRLGGRGYLAAREGATKSCHLGTGLTLAFALLGACSVRSPSGASVTILITDDVLGLDPNKDAESNTQSVLYNVFEPLVDFDENLGLRTVLAESWEHPEPERWRFRLRKGIHFHDGTPLTAELVRDALLRVRDAKDLEASDYLSQVRDVLAVDATTVDIVTREPRGLLANLAPVHVTKADSSGQTQTLVGTGPYRIREWKRKEKVVLERWPGYWGPPPEFATAVFVPVPSASDRLARLEEGNADIACEVPPDLPQDSIPGVRFIGRSGVTSFYIGMNLRRTPRSPFADARVRRALHLGIDRGAIVEQVLLGAGRVLTQPIPPSIFGFNPRLPEPHRDVTRARALLAEAGHSKGLASRLDFSPGRLPAARLIQESLREIGVEVTLNPLAGNGVYDLAKAGESNLFFVGWSLTSGEASEFYEFCLHTPTDKLGFNNYGGYSSPRIDRIAETNAAVLDQRERQKLLQEAAAIVMEELPVLPLYVADDVYGLREHIRFTPRADGEIRLLDVRRAIP
jgi:peptide/nickel transport system substrate-binding protein